MLLSCLLDDTTKRAIPRMGYITCHDYAFNLSQKCGQMPETKRVQILALFEAARQPLFEVLDTISTEHLNWNPAPESRSIGEICRHLYRVDIWFLKRLGIVPIIDEDAPGSAEEIAGRMRQIQQQIIENVEECDSDADLFIERHALEGEAKAQLGPDVVHIAQHYLYHLAQIIYLRRAQDRTWSSPMQQWEAATHLIGDYVLA